MSVSFPFRGMAADSELFPHVSNHEGPRGLFAELTLEDAAVIGKFLGMKDRNIGLWGAGQLSIPLVALYLMMGAKVMIARRDLGALEKLKAALGRHLPVERLHCASCDVTSEAAIRSSLVEMETTFGGVDTVIGLAGGVIGAANAVGGKTLQDVTAEAVIQQLMVDYVGSFNLIKAAEPYLQRSKNGPSAGLVSSMSSQFPGLHGVHVSYGPAKAAVDTFMAGIARSWGPWGGRINSVAIGFGIADQNRHLLLDDKSQPTDRGNRFLSLTPLGGFVKPDDVAWAYLFLTSPLSAFITGHTLAVDGGYLVGRW